MPTGVKQRTWLMRAGRRVTVKVANRGAEPARGVTLRAWWGKAAPTGGPVQWSEVKVAGVHTINGRGTTRFDATLPVAAPARGFWFLVSADALADPSNLVPDASPPTQARELMELVAHDNNLALARL